MKDFEDMQSYIKSKIGEPYYLKAEPNKVIDRKVPVVATTLSSIEYKERQFIDLQLEKDIKDVKNKFKKITGCSRKQIKKSQKKAK